MKIRGNTIGTPLRPGKGVVKATDLTPEEKGQARKNMDAVASVNGTTPDENGNVEIETGGSVEGAVLYTEQNLTGAQKAQARANIGAAGGMVITFDDDLNCSHSYNQIIYALNSGLPVLYVRFHNEGYHDPIAISSGTVRWESDPLTSFTLYAGNELALFYDEEGGTEGWVEYHESNGGGGGGGGGPVEGAVLYNDVQDLTPNEQAMARENIGAADAETIGNISTALDHIIELQEELIGGESA